MHHGSFSPPGLCTLSLMPGALFSLTSWPLLLGSLGNSSTRSSQNLTHFIGIICICSETPTPPLLWASYRRKDPVSISFTLESTTPSTCTGVSVTKHICFEMDNNLMRQGPSQVTKWSYISGSQTHNWPQNPYSWHLQFTVHCWRFLHIPKISPIFFRHVMYMLPVLRAINNSKDKAHFLP